MVIFGLKIRGTCFSKSAAMFFTFNAVKCTEVVNTKIVGRERELRLDVHKHAEDDHYLRNRFNYIWTL